MALKHTMMRPRRLGICFDCLVTLRQPKGSIAINPLILTPQRPPGTSPVQAPPSNRHISTLRSQRARLSQLRHISKERSGGLRTVSTTRSPDLNAIHRRIQELSSSVLRPEDGKIPSEQRTLYVLEQLQSQAHLILDERSGPDGILKPQSSGDSRGKQETATSALLGSVNARQYPAFLSKASVLILISEKAEELVRHPNVFITAGIVKAYVELQSLLQQPSSFPDIFELYARKPAPRLKGKEVEYVESSPDKINVAIDSKTANAALSAAIQAHNLLLAIDLITASYSTAAFKKAKILKQAAIPISGLAVAPVAAYALSQSFSSLQQTMDPSVATGIAFAGIMTYVSAVSMVGYVAVTTANDQMDRVTWAAGVPLWERFVREEERAAVDRVAGAWGFSDPNKRGEEEGEDWEMLREWAGRRGMLVDKVSLMEGME